MLIKFIFLIIRILTKTKHIMKKKWSKNSALNVLNFKIQKKI